MFIIIILKLINDINTHVTKYYNIHLYIYTLKL